MAAAVLREDPAEASQAEVVGPLPVDAAGDLRPEEDGTAVEEEVLEDEETADVAAAEGAGTAATAEAYCKLVTK